MRIQLLTGGVVLLCGILGANASFAQATNSTDISGPLGSMTCAAFSALGPTAQADAVKQIAPASLTSNSGGTTAATPAASSTAAAGTPLEAGQLVAACQAAPATSTVHDAYSAFSSSPVVKAK
jgi:hypothetical protein